MDGGTTITLQGGDPVAVQLVLAIRGGEVRAVERLLADEPRLAQARITERGGSKTPLHVTTDWPGYSRPAPQIARLLIDAGADPGPGDHPRARGDAAALGDSRRQDITGVLARLRRRPAPRRRVPPRAGSRSGLGSRVRPRHPAGRGRRPGTRQENVITWRRELGAPTALVRKAGCGLRWQGGGFCGCSAGRRAVLADGNAQGGTGMARVHAAVPDGRHRGARDYGSGRGRARQRPGAA